MSKYTIGATISINAYANANANADANAIVLMLMLMLMLMLIPLALMLILLALMLILLALMLMLMLMLIPLALNRCCFSLAREIYCWCAHRPIQTWNHLLWVCPNVGHKKSRHAPSLWEEWVVMLKANSLLGAFPPTLSLVEKEGWDPR